MIFGGTSGSFESTGYRSAPGTKKRHRGLALGSRLILKPVISHIFSPQLVGTIILFLCLRIMAVFYGCMHASSPSGSVRVGDDRHANQDPA